MKTEHLLNEIAIRNGSKRFILILLTLSVLTNLLVCFMLFTRKTIVQTVLTPPEIRRTLTVSNVAFSKEYLEEIAPYHAYLLLNNTPQNVDFQNKQLLNAVAAEYKGALEKELNVKALWHKKRNLSSYFTSLQAAADVQDNTVKLKGRFEVKQNDKIISSKDRELLLSYRNTNGTIELMSIKEIYQQKSSHHADKENEELNAPEIPEVKTEIITIETYSEDFKGYENAP